ncbi:hypothetical protein [Klebsiella phage Kpn74]|uniref:Secreted protein n=1 Tax=Klebsiella phage Kpn74 TaxID=3044026 RepID=A0AAT9V606_9CAUD|nr:hypothetical protein [Klebsiella phage Kpn74]
MLISAPHACAYLLSVFMLAPGFPSRRLIADGVIPIRSARADLLNPAFSRISYSISTSASSLSASGNPGLPPGC